MPRSTMEKSSKRRRVSCIPNSKQKGHNNEAITKQLLNVVGADRRTKKKAAYNPLIKRPKDIATRNYPAKGKRVRINPYNEKLSKYEV